MAALLSAIPYGFAALGMVVRSQAIPAQSMLYVIVLRHAAQQLNN